MKTVVITGATSGIGLAVARALVREGFRVIGVGHSEESCARARDSVMTQNPPGSFECFPADLMQQCEVLRAADEIAARLAPSGGGLDVLINNAGCVRSWYTTTQEGYEQQFALNHLAGFLLTCKLLPFLQRAKGRVIITGSSSHKGIKMRWDDVMLSKRYGPLTAYKQSKLCNLLFAKGLNDRRDKLGIRAYAVDPGLVNTDIGNKQSGALVSFVWSLRKKRGVAPDVPAGTYVFLCTQEPQGLYFHLCRSRRCGGQVTSENADRLFELSETLCGIKYDNGEVSA